MNTPIPEIRKPAPGRRHARYSDEFRRQVVAACQAPGVSKAAIALANGLNANMLRRWVVESTHGRDGQLSTVKEPLRPVQIKPDFTPAQLNLGQILLLGNRYPEARALFEAVVAREVGNAAALMALADISFAQRDTGAGIAQLQRARDRNPNAVSATHSSSRRITASSPRRVTAASPCCFAGSSPRCFAAPSSGRVASEARWPRSERSRFVRAW